MLPSAFFSVRTQAIWNSFQTLPFIPKKYLGINIAHTLPLMFLRNFAPLVSQITLFLLISMLYTLIFAKTVQVIRYMISSFLWNGRLRLRLSLLQQFNSNAVLYLPNFLCNTGLLIFKNCLIG